MLRIVVKSDCLEVLEMSGEVTEIVAELGAAVGAMYNNIRMVNHHAANVFRAMVGLAMMPGSPTWQEVEGDV